MTDHGMKLTSLIDEQTLQTGAQSPSGLITSRCSGNEPARGGTKFGLERAAEIEPKSPSPFGFLTFLYQPLLISNPQLNRLNYFKEGTGNLKRKQRTLCRSLYFVLFFFCWSILV